MEKGYHEEAMDKSQQSEQYRDNHDYEIHLRGFKLILFVQTSRNLAVRRRRRPLGSLRRPGFAFVIFRFLPHTFSLRIGVFHVVV
jgi:hypothetical protein